MLHSVLKVPQDVLNSLNYSGKTHGRHKVNSIPEMELMGNSNSGMGIAHLKKGIGTGFYHFGIGKFDVELTK